MNQKATPVFDGLKTYVHDQRYSFHVPGHKDGHILPEPAKVIYQSLLTIDATEVADLDDLYHPTGILRDGEALLADYYGTRSSYFLVNGSTVGNLIMILATIRPGDRVLVQRDSHKSVFNGLKLAGAEPVFLAPEIDPQTGIGYGVCLESLNVALQRFPDARALILTYPNYYGMAGVIGPMIECAHHHGMAVLVDEAHGPHFHLGAPMPPSALDQGADLVVQSAHKMLPAMTMGAWLHCKTTRVDQEKIEAIRAMLQTSSPSYPIMASLDLARYFLASLTTDKLTAICHNRDTFAAELDAIEGIDVLKAVPGAFHLDPFKLTLGLQFETSGFAFQERLIAAGIYPELADPHHVLLTLGLSERENYAEAVYRIRASLSSFPRTHAKRKTNECLSFPLVQKLDISYREMDQLSRELVDLQAAEGAVAAEAIIPYPPGIPLVLQGEKVTAEQIRRIETLLAAGAVFQNTETAQHKIMIYQSGVA